jgi:glycosyltransferase involved in cell wall biosynthesis
MLSIIIATRESERPLVRTLAALVPGAAAGVVREVIVADGQSRDGTVEVADIAGCRVLVADDPLGARLGAAAASARAPWLMFLRPGVILDATWIDETVRFMDDHESGDLKFAPAAVFRRAPKASAPRPVLIEALSLACAALGARPRPEQGLVVTKACYQRVGGHRENADDPEADLIARIGRRRLVMLRSGALDSGR